MWIGPTHRCQQKRSAMCSSGHVPRIENCNGVISPLVLISLAAWEPTNPFWQVKIVTPKKSIGSRVRASPGRAFCQRTIFFCTGCVREAQVTVMNSQAKHTNLALCFGQLRSQITGHCDVSFRALGAAHPAALFLPQ